MKNHREKTSLRQLLSKPNMRNRVCVQEQSGTVFAAVVAMFVISTLVLSLPAIAAEAPGPVKPVEVKQALADLGKRLFFDTRLSGDGELACASCHQPEKGFADGKQLSDAYPGSLGFRNTPTLINVAQRAVWFHDGRMGTNLNDVTREMITETYLMNMDMRLMQERLKQDPEYVKMFDAAGLGEPSNGGVRNAIPEYLKTLISKNAPYDVGTLSQSAARGQSIFMGKGGCIACHTGDRFTDDKPHNTGVSENNSIFEDPLRHITFVTFAKFMGIGNYMNLRRDVGAHVVTNRSDRTDYGRFITPTLRELNYTAPYMHNGTLQSLDEVVSFYNEGGGDDINKDPRLKPLFLSEREQQDLVGFLQSLSGDPLTSNTYVVDDVDTDYVPIKSWRKTNN